MSASVHAARLGFKIVVTRTVSITETLLRKEEFYFSRVFKNFQSVATIFAA